MCHRQVQSQMCSRNPFACPSLCLADKLLHASSVKLVVARALSMVPTEVIDSEHVAELFHLLFWHFKAGEGREISDDPEPVAHDVLVPDHLEVFVGTV